MQRLLLVPSESMYQFSRTTNRSATTRRSRNRTRILVLGDATFPGSVSGRLQDAAAAADPPLVPVVMRLFGAFALVLYV